MQVTGLGNLPKGLDKRVSDEMKTYLKPEVYEKLAMEYVLGSMTTRVKNRFEYLMEQYPYIAASVEEYQYKMGNLVQYLPEEQPHPRVWEAIETALDAQESRSRVAAGGSSSSFWNFFNPKFLGVAFSLLLVVLIAVPLTTSNKQEPTVISSALMSESNEAMVEVVATKDDMMMEIKVMHDIEVPEGMRLALWCYPKDHAEKPMNMGTVAASGMTEMPIDQNIWRGLKKASEFVVSVEPVEGKADNPSGQVLLKGAIKLASL